MFLTKKAFWKILILAICCFLEGSFCVAAGAVLAFFGAGSKLLFVLGAVCFVMCPLCTAWGLYAEGKGKFINLGNKLIRNELKPAVFIREYVQLRNTAGLVLNKPGIEVLRLAAMAYDALDDRENSLSSVEEMIAAAGEKKKVFVNLIKSSYLFSYGMVEEAEALFAEACAAKQDFSCRMLAEAILVSDRAMAMEEYKTAENYYQKMLTRAAPKLDPLSKLVIHFALAKIYERTQDKEQAIFHYTYCADYGGETAIKESAKSALERLQ